MRQDESRVKTGVPAIEAEGLTRRFDTFVAVEHVSLRILARRDLRLPGLEWLRHSEDDENAHTSAVAARETVRPADARGDLGTCHTDYRSTASWPWGSVSVSVLPFAFCRTRGGGAGNTAALRFAGRRDTRRESFRGIRERLQLAVAVLHTPPLILAGDLGCGSRDRLWRTLIDLS